MLAEMRDRTEIDKRLKEWHGSVVVVEVDKPFTIQLMGILDGSYWGDQQSASFLRIEVKSVGGMSALCTFLPKQVKWVLDEPPVIGLSEAVPTSLQVFSHEFFTEHKNEFQRYFTNRHTEDCVVWDKRHKEVIAYPRAMAFDTKDQAMQWLAAIPHALRLLVMWAELKGINLEDEA